MAESEKTPSDAADAAAKANAARDLPHVESPSISPAKDDDAPAETPAPVTSLTLFTPRAESKSAPRFEMPQMSRRVKRRAVMAASIALAGCFGAIAGALAMQYAAKPETKIDIAALEENAAMRKSIAHLSKELTSLKAGVDAATKSATSQIAKIADRVEKIDRSETTGSIAKQAAVAPPAATPLPPARPQLVSGWSGYTMRDGSIVVEGRPGVYEVSPGTPLPGLGPVESIRRDGDRWVISTPKGIIVASNAPPPRPRMYYPPYFRPF